MKYINSLSPLFFFHLACAMNNETFSKVNLSLFGALSAYASHTYFSLHKKQEADKRESDVKHRQMQEKGIKGYLNIPYQAPHLGQLSFTAAYTSANVFCTYLFSSLNWYLFAPVLSFTFTHLFHAHTISTKNTTYSREQNLARCLNVCGLANIIYSIHFAYIYLKPH